MAGSGEPKKVFITGATGFIGGEAFWAISTTHPDWSISALVRSTDKGAVLAAAFPKTRMVYGNLDDANILEEESKNADIVINCADADHGGAISAIVSGLATHKGYLIHTSGTGLLIYDDMSNNRAPGSNTSERIHDDYDGVAAMTISMPDEAPHRKVDKLVLNSLGLGVHPAVVAPPLIYGEHRGPTGVASVQVPGLVRMSLDYGQAVMAGKGLGYWNSVHVQDLGQLFLKLAEAAASGDERVKWDAESYYFCENGEQMWKDVSAMIGREGKKQGLFDTADVVSLEPDELNKFNPTLSITVGYNSRGRATRARKILGWEPKAPALEKTVAETVEKEALKWGYKAGHAAKAAGN